MNKENMNKLFYDFKILYDARGKDRLAFNNKAEMYFSEILKLLLTLSVGMIAFLSIAKDVILKGLDTNLLLNPLRGFVIAIILAVASLLLMAYHYKCYTDKATKDEADIYKKWADGKYEEIKKRVEVETENFKKRKGADWQWSTIIVGVLSLIAFTFSIFSIMMALF